MPSVALSHRAILRALIEAGGPVYAGELAKVSGISASHITVSMSVVRAAIKPHGAKLKTYGSHETLRYYIETDDWAPLHAVGAVPEGRLWFRGFSDTSAAVLRTIVEAGGRAVSISELVTAAYAKPYPSRGAQVVALINRMRERLEIQGSSETILRRGHPGAPSYAWGPVSEDRQEPALLDDGITLPPVGGAYRYAAGRLTLDGMPVGRAA